MSARKGQKESEEMSTFGPAYDEQRDGERIRTGMMRVLNCLRAAAIRGEWLTIDEIKARIEAQYHTIISWGSVDADVRHWKKPQFGSLDIRRNKRWNVYEGKPGNISEYRLFVPAEKVKVSTAPFGTREQEKLFDIPAQHYRDEVRR